VPRRVHRLRAFNGPVFLPVIVWNEYGTIGRHTSGSWANVTFHFEATMQANAGTVYARAFNKTDGLDVAGSQVSTMASVKTRVRSGSITLVDGKEYVSQFAHSVGGAGEMWGAQVLGVPI
jgi:hypothetical protein